MCAVRTYATADVIAMRSPAESGVWLSLDTGEHGPIVDSDIAGSWNSATSDVEPDMGISAGADIEDDKDYVSVSLELFNQLLKIRANCTCTPT